VIGLDTNILVRFIMQDDAKQSALATHVIETRLTAEDPGYVNVVAMAEMAWVLESSYRRTAREIAAAIERVLQLESLMVESEQDVFTAMIAVKEGRGTFADALIASLDAAAGCAATLTFDRKALRLTGFEHP
jgi:predicted nucleic-acid-binding protein